MNMNLEELKTKEAELKQQLNYIQADMSRYEYNQKKEQYGSDFCCNKCRFDCIEDPGDFHTTCLRYRCVLCCGDCEEYLPENNLSKYIKEKDRYSWDSIWSSIAKVLDYNDVVNLLEKGTESHFEKAIKIYEITDKN